MTEPDFRKAHGSRISNRAAQVYGAALTALEAEMGRPILPADVVAHATDPASPFHSWVFDVDAATAEYRYRLRRATDLIHAIEVQLPDRGQSRVRAFVIANYAGDRPMGDPRGYTSTHRALTDDPAVISRQVERCRAEAASVVARYEAWVRVEGFAPARVFVDAAREFSGTGPREPRHRTPPPRDTRPAPPR